MVDEKSSSTLVAGSMKESKNNPQIPKARLKNNEDYLLVYPKNVSKDMNRTINSLGFVDKDLLDSNQNIEIDQAIRDVSSEIDDINKKIASLISKEDDIIKNLAYNIYFDQVSDDYESSMAFGEEYFYFSALVAEADLDKLKELRNNYPQMRMNVESNNMEDLSKDNKPKIEKENKSNSNEETYLLVYPEKVKKDVARSINTLGFVDYDIPTGLSLENLDENIRQTDKDLAEVNRQIADINSRYEDVLDNISYSLDYSSKANELKNNMAHGDDYFYLSGWVPESELNQFVNLEHKYDKTILTTKDDSSVNESPPTRLKNNKAFKPFEYLVNMYGAPNYDEVDPTPFFAITYMLLYGLMFGDLGQGLVFLAIGFYLSKKNKTFGALLKRIGISASVFGLMYGSVFGREDLIPALLIKPFDNVMTVLIASVAFGVCLMIISYIIGIYNKVHKQNNIEEGIFGKEGLAGLMMMIAFIIIVLNLVNVGPIPMVVGTVMLIASIIMMIFKQPIARKIEGETRLYDQGKGDYYIESSFSIIEALLSVFSNLVSFTRVGAFAINHVGLYMAFEVMANLTGGGFWGFIILLLGNILIIGLEGMIVFIQGLRLEFYEMFSKYYEGNGRLFRPINSREIN